MKKKITLLLILLGSFFYAQVPTPGPGPGPGSNPAPIDDYLFALIPMALVLIGMFVYRKDLVKLSAK